MAGDESNPFDRVVEPWEGVVADMEATAEGYRETGWDVLEVHPGDVTALDGSGGSEDGTDDEGGGRGDERYGLEVLIPDPEFEQLEAWIDEGAQFGSYEVYRTTENDVVFLQLVFTDATTERVVCVPAYYETPKVQRLREHAERTGVFFTYVRRLRRDRVVTFTSDDPDLFFPK